MVLVFIAVCDNFSARCLAGSTRWYADTLLRTRVALFSPWFGAHVGKRALVVDTALWAWIAFSLFVVLRF